MRLRYIVQGHGIDVSAACGEGTAERYQRYNSAAAVLTRCEFHRQRLMKIGLPPGEVHVNPGGVDVPDKITGYSAAACKRFLAIGRFVPKKGPIYLLEAFRLAAARDREITLDYVGGGELLPAARQFVIACRLELRVRLHAAGEDGGVCSRGSVVSSFNIALPIPRPVMRRAITAAIQEAMAQGMAVVSTRHAGISEAVEHGVSGLLVEERDVEAMAEEMGRVANDTALCTRLGSSAHLKAKDLYSWPAERARLLAALERAG